MFRLVVWNRQGSILSTDIDVLIEINNPDILTIYLDTVTVRPRLRAIRVHTARVTAVIDVEGVWWDDVHVTGAILHQAGVSVEPEVADCRVRGRAGQGQGVSFKR